MMGKKLIIIMAVFALSQGSASAIAELPDPTRPADFSVAPEIIETYELPKELIDWSVSAIRISGSDRSAIVNGKLVRVGDQIGPARILEINPAAVVLDYEKRQVYVRLFSNVVDKRPRKN